MIVVFARVPEPGKTKTRLIPRLGASGAAHLAAAMTGDTLDAVRATGLPFRVALAGDTTHPWVRTLDAEWEPQVEGDLGRRLAHALRDGGVVIGTDAPTLPPALLHEAHASTADVVLAPAFDGGNPANRKRSVGRHATTSPARSADAPGIGNTRWPADTASRTSL